MNNKRVATLCKSLIILLCTVTFSANAANELVSPFAGSTLHNTYEVRFSPLTVLVGPLDEKKNPAQKEIEGALSSRIFTRADDVSTYELYRSYEGTLKKAGFEILLACQQGKCNAKSNVRAVYGHPKKEIQSRDYARVETANRISTATQWLVGWGNHYISAKKESGDRTVYVSIIISDQKKLYSIDTLWVDSLEEGTVSISLDALKNKIDSEGKVVLDGIFFETGKDVVTAESKPSLTVITEYLNSSPGKLFYVVGHTDDTGGLDNNIRLSDRRANAVIEELKTMGVDVSRLSGHGVGPFAPAATNASEKGRSGNRRVELVLKAQ